MAGITFYDLELEGLGKKTWSPNTCKTRFALNLKNIPYDTEWVTFTSIPEIIPAITKTGDKPTVPIIVDKKNQKVIQDSWEIVKYLEEAYPESPSVFNGNIGIHSFFQKYSEKKVVFPVFKMVLMIIYANCGPAQGYLRQTREAFFGKTFEEIAGKPEDHVDELKEGLVPIHQVLQSYPFVSGDQAGWADVVLLSHLHFLEALRPELFKSFVLEAFDDNVLADYWNRTEYIRK